MDFPQYQPVIGLFVGSNGSGWLAGASEDLMPGVNQGGSNPQREQDLWELCDGFVRAYDGFIKKIHWICDCVK